MISSRIGNISTEVFRETWVVIDYELLNKGGSFGYLSECGLIMGAP